MARPEPPWRGAVAQAVAVSLVMAAVAVLRSPYTGIALRIWLVALGAIACSALLGGVLAGTTVSDGPRLRLGRRRPAPERLRALEELEHAVSFAQGTAFDLHYRLRPRLVRIAEQRLAARGVSLTGDPERARALLGAEAWELLRPDRTPPADRAARGVPPAYVRRVLERLDAT